MRASQYRPYLKFPNTETSGRGVAIAEIETARPWTLRDLSRQDQRKARNSGSQLSLRHHFHREPNRDRFPSP